MVSLSFMASPLFLVADIADLVLRSGPVAKGVLALLLCFSLFSWTLILAKWLSFGRARRQSGRFLQMFRKGPRAFEISVTDQFLPSPLVGVYEAGLAELTHQAGGGGKVNKPASLQRALQIASSEELSRLESKLNWLATTGAVTPFIGLFGTVWGIIDAFQSLATAGAGSIRIVAPGISEALITTAAGLAAAIPAVIFYNMFLNDIRGFGARMDNFALEFQNLAERHYT
jgi:biopolymer transport protein TolQ